MKPNPSRPVWPLYCGGALLVLALLIYWVVDAIQHGPERKALEDTRQARDAIHRQITGIPSGMERQINIGNKYDPPRSKLEADAFLAEMQNIIGPFNLGLEGVPDVGEFLNQIRGLPGLRRLSFYSCELKNSVTGLECIATLPDLESLMLSEVRLTGEGLEKLKASPRLTDVWITYFPNINVEVADALALPHLRKLGLDASYNWDSKDWLQHAIDDLPKTLELEELTLCHINLSPEEVRDLRQRYPNCVIKVLGGNEKEIAPLPKNDRVR